MRLVLRRYPPNGWGCQCYVVGATRKTAERMGGRVEPAPNDGFAPDGTPNGIDKGWDYMPGQSTVDTLRKQLLEGAKSLPEPLAQALINDLTQPPPQDGAAK